MRKKYYPGVVFLLLALANICLISAQTGFFNMTEHTLAWWRFDSQTNGTISDESGHFYTGTISGNAPLEPSQYGNAISCNGKDQYLTVSTWKGLAKFGTVEIKLLFKPRAYQSLQEIITDHHWSDTKYGFVLRLSDQYLQFAIGTSSGWHYLTDTKPITLNEWHVITAKIDQNKKTVSIKTDNAPEIVQTYSGTYNPSTINLLRIAACSPPPPSRFLNALIDEIIIDCDNTDTSTNSFFVVDKNTIALWRFNEIANGYINDVSGNNNHARIYGSPTLVAAQYGKGIYLDGIDDYLKVFKWTKFLGYNNITFEVLCTPISFTDDGTANGDSISEILTSHQFETKSGFVLRYRNRRAEFACGASGEWYFVQGYDTTKVTKPHYIRAFLDISSKGIVVKEDSTFATSNPFVGSYIPSTDTSLIIGAFAVAPVSRLFHGIIDEIKISGEKGSVTLVNSTTKKDRNVCFINNRKLQIIRAGNLQGNIQIYDMRGRTLINKSFNRNEQSLTVALNNFSPGFYYYTLKTGNATITQKFNLF